MDTPPSRVTPDLQTDFAGKLNYGAYLQLPTLLSAQKPLSTQHDEMLFIVLHQVEELWLKQVGFELAFAVRSVAADALDPAFKALARVSRIQEQLVAAWDVLSTMTPSEFLSFRSFLGQASGFQSAQYRQLEFRLGAKDPKMMEAHRHDPASFGALQEALDTPSLYDEAIRLLARRGFALPDDVVARDVRQPYVASPAVQEAWLAVYRDPERWFDLYQLAEELVDIEDGFQQWRFRHLKTVERIIGFRRGTGGSAGVGFLRTALERSFFPELWALRAEL